MARTRSRAARAARRASPGGLLRRLRDFAHVDGAKAIDRAVADKALGALEVDAAGLDAMDRRYLSTIALNYGGGPVGVETIAAALSEPRDAIEDIIEPFLIQKGFIQRTPRGRLLTSHAFRHLGLAEPARDPTQFQIVQPARRARSESSASTASCATAAIRRWCASITRTPISPASSITPIICATWSAGAPTTCG